MDSESYKITVATVCLNAESVIRKTIESVLAQEYDSFEYLIVDGVSKDNTLAIVNEYVPLFAEKNITYRIVSEKDSGLYDAMNKAADLSNGEWIIYMNAGDTLLDGDVLNKASGMLDPDLDVLYGDILLAEGEKFKLHRSGEIMSLNRCNPIMHQSCLTRVKSLLRYRFDTSYKICADYDLFLKLYKDNSSCFRKTDLVIATFMMGGLSTTAISLREKEFSRARKVNNIKESRFTNLYVLGITTKEYIRLFTIKIFDKKFFSSKRGYYSFDEILRMI